MQENQNNTQNQQNTQTEAVEQSINSTANVAEDVKVAEQGVFHPAQENPYTQRVYQDQQQQLDNDYRNQYYMQRQPQKDWMNELSNSKIFGILSIVISFFIPIVSWVLGGFGLSKANAVPDLPEYKEEKKKCQKLNLCGLILPGVFVVLTIVLYLIAILLFSRNAVPLDAVSAVF